MALFNSIHIDIHGLYAHEKTRPIAIDHGNNGLISFRGWKDIRYQSAILEPQDI